MSTRKYYRLLVYIDHYLKQAGLSPSFEEMKDALHLKSKAGIHRLISSLEERGYVARRRRARALDVLRLPGNMSAHEKRPTSSVGTGTPPASALDVIQCDFTQRLSGVRTDSEVEAIQLPMYGRIAAGSPIEALRDPASHIEVPLSLLGPGEHYALEIAGNSMIEAGILDGDKVIILRANTAENGQIIVALIDDNVVTLKRLRVQGDSIALEPCNMRHKTCLFPADRVRVQGRLVALMRTY